MSRQGMRVLRDGSPPRAWGQFHPADRGALLLRGSPPRAWGQCDDDPIEPAIAAVHPHVRGDNYIVTRLYVNHLGSPPRAWGQCLSVRSVAGRLSVHPHVRGDNTWQRLDLFALFRFTPTCVGTIPAKVWFLRGTPVHPHVRGDNFVQITIGVLAPGSPPRAWGQSRESDSRSLRVRFTPTCVGTMSPPNARTTPSYGSPPRAWGQSEKVDCQALFSTVHPHVRGDNVITHSPAFIDYGSPPRAWGQWWGTALKPAWERFTPTCVGTIRM